MAAYAVTGHIHGARPHRPRSEPASEVAVTRVTDLRPGSVPEDLTAALFAGLDPDAQPPAGATWAETTFFLFDPESWR
jgi:hypothetical protein